MRTYAVPVATAQELQAEASAYRCLFELGLPHWDAEYGASLIALCNTMKYVPQTRYEKSLHRRIKELIDQHKAAQGKP